MNAFSFFANEKNQHTRHLESNCDDWMQEVSKVKQTRGKQVRYPSLSIWVEQISMQKADRCKGDYISQNPKVLTTWDIQ